MICTQRYRVRLRPMDIHHGCSICRPLHRALCWLLYSMITSPDVKMGAFFVIAGVPQPMSVADSFLGSLIGMHLLWLQIFFLHAYHKDLSWHLAESLGRFTPTKSLLHSLGGSFLHREFAPLITSPPPVSVVNSSLHTDSVVDLLGYLIR